MLPMLAHHPHFLVDLSTLYCIGYFPHKSCLLAMGQAKSGHSPLNLQQHSANAVIVQSMFFLMVAKFCCSDNFDITLVKTIATPRNVFTLFRALSCRHSRSLVM